MEHHHHHQLEDCSKIDPNRNARHKKKTACMQLVVKDVNKKAKDSTDNFRQQLERTAYGQSASEDVNKKADDFIKNFRKQLKFEREESLKRYREAVYGQKG